MLTSSRRRSADRGLPIAKASTWAKRSLLVLMMALFVAVGYLVVNRSHAAACTVSADLVNSCRPWFGAAVAGNPAAPSSSQLDQFTWLEGQIGQKMDFYRQYNTCSLDAAGTGIDCTGGGPPMSPGSDEYKLGTRANTYVQINWKPYSNWAAASGGNTLVDDEIRQAAANIKAVAPKKVMLTIWHEPQNDVTPADGCTGAKHGTAGTPADYNAMWKHIENIFAAQGVTNVIWTMDYMSTNQTDFDCQVPQLWPGSSYIDWVIYDVYGTNSHPTWADSTGRLYGYLANLSTTHPNMGLESKPWGVGEFGTCGNQPSATVTLQQSIDSSRQYYVDAKTAYDNGRYPNLKLYLVWDDKISAGGWDCLTNYDADGSPDPTKQADFNGFANDVLNTNAGPSPSPTPCDLAVSGNLNHDCHVDVFDLSILLSNWGIANSPYDMDGDKGGIIDVFDLSILLSHWTG